MSQDDLELGPAAEPAAPRPWVRSVPVRTMFRPHEAAELAEIAEVWGVPTATALWAIAATELARYRRRAPDLGEHGMAIAAGLAVTRCTTDAAVSRAKGDR